MVDCCVVVVELSCVVQRFSCVPFLDFLRGFLAIFDKADFVQYNTTDFYKNENTTDFYKNRIRVIKNIIRFRVRCKMNILGKFGTLPAPFKP